MPPNCSILLKLPTVLSFLSLVSVGVAIKPNFTFHLPRRALQWNTEAFFSYRVVLQVDTGCLTCQAFSCYLLTYSEIFRNFHKRLLPVWPLEGIFFPISVYCRIRLGHVKRITFPYSKLRLIFLYTPWSTPSNYMRIK